MEKILIVLIILLVLALLVLVGITLFGKKKNKKEIIEEVKIEEQPVVTEPVIELEEDLESKLEQTREQTEVIEIISSMQEKAKDLTEKVSDYEDEQEENAIISYTELLNAVKSKKEVQEKLDFEVKEEPKEVYKEEKKEPYDDSRKFHSSEAISPLGRINKNVPDDSYKSTVKPSNMQDEDFLKSLKDFRSNL